MRPPKQKQPQVKKGLCRVLEHVDVDVDLPGKSIRDGFRNSFFFIFNF